MPHVNTAPVRIPVPGGKVIEEHVGVVATHTRDVSVAHMIAPPGWEEPYQTPEFDEITVVVRGFLVVEAGGERHEVREGQSILTRAGERIRYTTGPLGAEYVAVCLPAFTPESAHRED
jgi:mannose-6-phosphate isomerase-like protein (cupin superfamily)